MACIITGTDFSPQADRAFLRAAQLARQTGLGLRVVHALGAGHAATGPFSPQGTAARHLAALCSSVCGPARATTVPDILEGDPETLLPAQAADLGARLLVIGPHRPDPLRDFTASRLASKLARRLPCPLLLANGPPFTPYRRVLVATDLSAGAMDAARAMADLAPGSGGDVVFYHSYDPRPFGGIAAGTGPRSAMEEARAQRQAAIEGELAAMASATGIEPHWIVAEPAEASDAEMILRMARSGAFDLVVAGMQGKSAIQRFLLGSVAETLLREAELDLLLVPPASRTPA